jgi:GNAT superfamily N-acetyltransferase
MIFEPIIENDIHHLRELQPDGWPDVIPIFEYYIDSPFCRPIKVVIENKIVGIGTAILLNNSAWLAHIIVNPDFRKKGIGSSIVHYLLGYLKNIGIETISLIATDSGYPVYKNAGFKEQTEYVFFEREEPLKDYFRSKNVVQYTSTNAEDIFSLDKIVTGEDRRTLLNDKLENSYVYQKNGKLMGFYLPGLGDGLIIADNEEAGIELMRLRYSIINKGVLPIDNIEGIRFLKENGFLETKRAKRMILGKEFSWQPGKVFNRIGGNLG